MTLRKFFLLITFSLSLLLNLSCSKKPIKKEMKMPMLFDTKEQAEKEAYKFDCEGAHRMGDKWMPCSMHKHNH